MGVHAISARGLLLPIDAEFVHLHFFPNILGIVNKVSLSCFFSKFCE